MTRHNVDQLDGFKALADSYGAEFRVTRLRPSGRGADSWPELHPTAAQQRQIYRWLLAHCEGVLTGDSFFHLNASASPFRAEHVRRGAGRLPDRSDRRRLRLPVRHPRQFLAGSVRDPGGFTEVWRDSEFFRSLREPSRRRLCELWQLRLLPGRLHGGEVLHRSPPRRPGPRVRARPGPGRAGVVAAGAGAAVPRPVGDHSKPVTFLRKATTATR